MNTRPVRENQSASFDIRSDAPVQPASAGPSSNNTSSGFRSIVPRRTLDQAPPSTVTICPTIPLRHDHGCPQGPVREPQIIINSRESLIFGIAGNPYPNGDATKAMSALPV